MRDWKERGRDAERPAEITARGFGDVLRRVYSKLLSQQVTLVAAGVTYYLLLSLFPAMSVFISLYGLFAKPATIASHSDVLMWVLPHEGAQLVADQLTRLANEDASTLSLAFVSGLLAAFWSANSGIKAIFEAMNVAYDEREKRSFVALNLLSFVFMIGALFVALVLILAMGFLPAALAYLRISGWAELLVRLGRWPIMLSMFAIAAGLIYRYGPSRAVAKKRWITWGAVVSSFLWVAGSIAYSYYLEHFAGFQATYGTLGAFVGFLVWIWVSTVVLILGAVLNAELEHQTAVDSTTGNPEPMGSRGAHVADTLGKASWP